MQNWVLKECLQQLLKIYVYAEQQYIHAAIDSNSPVLQIFYQRRAYERSDFILKVQREIDFLEFNCSQRKSFSEFYKWHNLHYSNANLNEWPTTDIQSITIDAKALEICRNLLIDPLPPEVFKILEMQSVQIESTLLSLAFLRSLKLDK